MIHDPLTELKRSSYEKESREITNDAVKYIKEKNAPVFLEFETFRWLEHVQVQRGLRQERRQRRLQRRLS